MRWIPGSRAGRGGFCVSGILALLIGVVGVVGTAVKKPVPGATTRPGGWVEVEDGVQVRAYLGFWRDNDLKPNADGRPGEAAKVVRLVKDKPGDTHFGVTVVFKDEYSGQLNYRETVTLPAKPRTWDDLNESLRWLKVNRQLSPDGRSSTMTEQWDFIGGHRILPTGDVAVNLPSPFVLYDFDAGDPPGKWVIDCWVNDARVGHFEFEVVAGKEGERDVVVVRDEAMQLQKPPDLKGMWLPADGDNPKEGNAPGETRQPPRAGKRGTANAPVRARR